MREIKFRLWSKTSQQIISWEQIVSGNKHHVIWYDDYPTMQFTGLQDKNGKDIYEGDICQYKNGNEYSIAEIKYIYSSFRLSTRLGSHSIPVDYIKIIGDIHTTPELLK
jgi:hypothetical protein